jgi:hypothetical protein
MEEKNLSFVIEQNFFVSVEMRKRERKLINFSSAAEKI